jgi:hypothetical protein
MNMNQSKNIEQVSAGHCVKIGFIAMIAVLGFDLFLHAGILSPLYSAETPFLLDSERAFQLIPLGYLSFAIMIGLMVWLIKSLGIHSWRRGLRFGLVFGGTVWISLALGLASISTARPILLAGWAVGQTLELGYAGALIGAGLPMKQTRRLLLIVIGIAIVSAALGIVIQNVWGLSGGVAH